MIETILAVGLVVGVVVLRFGVKVFTSYLFN
jgi:hypothetical protein